jgi:hypothetical protein
MVKWPRTRSDWLWTVVDLSIAVGSALVLLLVFSGGDPPLGRDYVLAVIGFASAVSLVFIEISLTLGHIEEARRDVSDGIAAHVNGAQNDIESNFLALAAGISAAINELGAELRNFGGHQTGNVEDPP